MIDLFTTSGIIGDSLLNMLNGICLFIDSIVYWFISLLYQVFISISQVNLFNESTLRTIIDRVFTILGVLMLFIMAYQIILLIINPDKLSGDNGAKKLVTKVITSIVLIVLLPTIFKYMQIFQYDVLTSNVIGNVVLGGSSANSDYDIKSAGTSMALTIASAFFHPVDEGKEYSYIACKQLGTEAPGSCETYIEVYDQCLENNDPGALFMNSELQGLLNLNLWESFWGSERQMKYIPIISTIAAILALRMIIAFCLDIGVRVAKLGFLQVVAPIPIALNINAKESIFGTKWFKSLKDTYLDIFMKLIIIYFSMFAISMVPEVLSNLWAGEGNFLVQILATVVVILGILQFAKDGPKLIIDLFNIDPKNLDFNIRKRLDENTYAQRGLATAQSGAIRSLQNFHRAEGAGNKVLSAAGGLFGGGYRGWKNSEGIDSFKKVKGAVNTAVAADEEAYYKNERQRQRGVSADWGDIDGNAIPGITRLAGMAAEKKDQLQDARKGFKELIANDTSPAKYEAAKKALDSTKGFFSKFNEGDTELEAIKSNEKALLEKVNARDLSEAYINSFKATDARYQSLSDDQIYDAYSDDLRKYIGDNKTRAEKERTIANFRKKKGNMPKAAEIWSEELGDSLLRLGPEASRKILQDNGIRDIGEIEKILKFASENDFNNPSFSSDFDKLKATEKQIKIELGRQQAAYIEEKKGEK